MKFGKETENKIREVFRQEQFQDFMFEVVLGSSTDKNKKLYRDKYKLGLQEVENKLVCLIKSHINHNIPINRNSFVTFVLENIAEKFGGNDLDCNHIRFFAFCNQLYYMIFDIVAKPYF